MIPLSNREIFISLLKQGMDIRNACKEASISKSSLYRYFAEFPGYKNEVYDAMDLARKDTQKRVDNEELERMEILKKMIKSRVRK